MLKPLGKNVVLKKVPVENVSKSGLILSSTGEKKHKLVVENVGGYHADIPLKKGDEVVLSQHPRAVVEGDFLIVNAEDIVAIK